MSKFKRNIIKKEKERERENQKYIENFVLGKFKKTDLIQYFETQRGKALFEPYIQGKRPPFVTPFPISRNLTLVVAMIVKYMDSEKYGSYYPFWIFEVVIIDKNQKQINFNDVESRFYNAVFVFLKLMMLDAGIQTDKHDELSKNQIGWHIPLRTDEIMKMPGVFQDLVRAKEIKKDG